MLINSSSERFGYIAENAIFATELILNPDSKNTRAAKRYSTFAICLVRLQTFSTQSGTRTDVLGRDLRRRNARSCWALTSAADICGLVRSIRRVRSTRSATMV